MNILKFHYIIIIVIILNCMFSGCSTSEEKEVIKKVVPWIPMDDPSILPDWIDGTYHNYYDTLDVLSELQIKYPDFVNVFSIGKSVLGKDIWCIRVTNESNNGNKYACVIDGCIHGNEWEAGEACLYLAEYLLINSENNKTLRNILNISEIYLIPLLNPDGRQIDERWNANGIDLNRNFDVHFGRLRSKNYPLGKLFGKIKIPYIHHRLLNTYSTNCGRYAFSEPETSALKNFMQSIDRLSFYVNCHTAVHIIAAQGDITYKPEYTISTHERAVTNTVMDWVTDHTEYPGIHGEDFEYTGIGCASDWVYKEYTIPSFIFELLNQDYEPMYGHGKHDHLVHWMQTTLPVFMYLLMNIKPLYHWQIPDIEPLLPEGIPPEPMK